MCLAVCALPPVAHCRMLSRSFWVVLAVYLLQRNALIEAVARLQVVAKNGDNVIKFDLAPKNQSLLVSAFSTGFGQGKELLACLQVGARLLRTCLRDAGVCM